MVIQPATCQPLAFSSLPKPARKQVYYRCSTSSNDCRAASGDATLHERRHKRCASVGKRERANRWLFGWLHGLTAHHSGFREM